MVNSYSILRGHKLSSKESVDHARLAARKIRSRVAWLGTLPHRVAFPSGNVELVLRKRWSHDTLHKSGQFH